jgi:hypothetical protein
MSTEERRQVFQECLTGHQQPWIPGACGPEVRQAMLLVREEPREGVLRPLRGRVPEQEQEAAGRGPNDGGGGSGGRACHLCNAGRNGTPFHTASSCPKAAYFQAFIQQRAQLVEQIKSVENKDRTTAVCCGWRRRQVLNASERYICNLAPSAH